MSGNPQNSDSAQFPSCKKTTNVGRLLLLGTLITAGCVDSLLTNSDRTAEQPGARSPSEDSVEIKTGSLVVLDGLAFVFVPSGNFRMGTSNPVVPPEFSACEIPQHDVRLSTGFWMSKTEIPVAAFREFVADTNYQTTAESSGLGCNSLNRETGAVQRLSETTWRNPGFNQSDDHPVVCVDWNDAVAFCDWLTTRHGRRFRLPTEAEWEYACRSGTETVFSTGDQPASLKDFANVGDSSLHNAVPATRGTAPWNDLHAFTAPVGSFQPNAFGLHDMHGNVGEWCLDWFDATYYRRSPSANPQGPTVQRQWRAVRGGSWYNTPYSCRSSGRHDGIETAASTTNGFRVVMEARTAATSR